MPKVNEITQHHGALPNMPQLDALRGCAVLAVMYQHFAPMQRLMNYLPTARLGVQLFFVLSGFLITGILVAARDCVSKGETPFFELRQFYIRRFLRIFPLFYGFVIGGAVLGIAGFRKPLLWHLTYSTNLYNAITGQWAGVTAHLWTLAVEEQFYLFWPWVILFLPRSRLLPLVGAIAFSGPLFRSILFLCGGSGMAIYTLTPSSLDAFALGGLLAIMRFHEQTLGEVSSRKRFARFALYLGLAGSAVTFSSLAWPKNYGWVFSIGANLALSLLFFWLIDCAASGFRGWIGNVLTWRPLLYIGKISYGMYVFHLAIPYCVGRLVHWLRLRWLSSAFQFEIVDLVVFSLLTVAVASASWFLYERPILKLKRRFPYTRNVPGAGNEIQVPPPPSLKIRHRRSL